jgi:hypothetical protein
MKRKLESDVNESKLAGLYCPCRPNDLLIEASRMRFFILRNERGALLQIDAGVNNDGKIKPNISCPACSQQIGVWEPATGQLQINGRLPMLLKDSYGHTRLDHTVRTGIGLFRNDGEESTRVCHCTGPIKGEVNALLFDSKMRRAAKWINHVHWVRESGIPIVHEVTPTVSVPADAPLIDIVPTFAALNGFSMKDDLDALKTKQKAVKDYAAEVTDDRNMNLLQEVDLAEKMFKGDHFSAMHNAMETKRSLMTISDPNPILGVENITKTRDSGREEQSISSPWYNPSARLGCVEFIVETILERPVKKVDDETMKSRGKEYTELLKHLKLAEQTLIYLWSADFKHRYVGIVTRVDKIFPLQRIEICFPHGNTLIEILQLHWSVKLNVTVLMENFWFYEAVMETFQSILTSVLPLPLHTKPREGSASKRVKRGDRFLKLTDGSMLDLMYDSIDEAKGKLMVSEDFDYGQANAALVVFGHICNRWKKRTLITGPPGTGKTYTVTNLIHLMLLNAHNIVDLPAPKEYADARDKPLEDKTIPLRILVLCKTNTCVDDTAIKIVVHLKKQGNFSNVDVVRVGGGYDFSNSDVRAMVEMNVKNTDVGHVALDEMNVSASHKDNEIRSAGKVDSAAGLLLALASQLDTDTKKCVYKEKYNEAMKELRALRHLRDLRLGKKMRKATIVLMATAKANISCSAIETYFEPHIVFVDEAAQELSGVVLPSLMFPKTIMNIAIGDEAQIPPRSQTDDYKDYCGSIMTVLKHYEPVGQATLTVQYRMFDELCDIVRLSPVYKELKTIGNIREKWKDTHPCSKYLPDEHKVFPYTFWNCNYTEEKQESIINGADLIPGLQDALDEGATSYTNRDEAMSIVMYVADLLLQKMDPKVVTVISPYTAQVELIKQLAKEVDMAIAIKTVDQFQGNENQIIIVSLVRSNSEGRIGFLKESGRLHVLLSRAKMRLLLFGNLNTFSMHNAIDPNTLWTPILSHFLERGRVHNFPELAEGVYQEAIDLYTTYRSSLAGPVEEFVPVRGDGRGPRTTRDASASTASSATDF